MSQSRHWAYISETGTTIGMHILIFAYQIGGPWLFKIFLFPVVGFYFLLRSDSRKASREYLVRVRKKTSSLPPVSWRLSFAHFWNFSLAIIDKFSIWIDKLSPDDVIIHNIELIDELVSRGQGGIFAISHLGNFEVLSALSEHHKGVKLTVLHHTKHAEKFNRVLKKYIMESNVELLQVTDLDVSLAMTLSEKIDRGEFIAIASDRVPLNNSKATVTCDFLGGMAEFPKGAYILAYILASPILMLICIKERNSHNVYIESLSESGKVPKAQRSSFISVTAQIFATRLEYYVCKAPLQWFNFYDFWYRDIDMDE